STDSDGTITSYEWDFGDGNSSAAPSPEHTYAEGGTYQVELTVTDDDGATSAITQEVTVEAPIPAPAITQITPAQGDVGTPVAILGTGFVGTTSVTFGGISAVFEVVTDAEISTTVPAGAV